MNCTCAQHLPLELSRSSIKKRIKASKAILKPLVLLAQTEPLQLKLLRCPHCAQHWQTGREWNFGNDEYVFQVPAIGVEEWLQEAYSQPASWLIYSAMMQDYYAKNPFEQSDNPCRVTECSNRALKLSGVCEQHHIAQLQRFGMLPKRPEGRLFAPYHIGAV